MSPLPHRQSGAVLFVALIMLLIITLLGIGSMREVVLETRITGNLLEQKRLQNAAESALREGERRITTGTNITQCNTKTTTAPCYISEATDLDYSFDKALAYSGLDGDTDLEREARWYLRLIGGPYTAGSTGASANGASNALASPETAQSGSTFYYEVNSQSYQDGNDSDTCTSATLCLTSTVTLLVE
nr:PilX N-terminal domain-containing pilus assembly protein [Pseudomonas sp. FRB 230]